MEKTFVARPYAKAIFDIAVDTNTLEDWDKALLVLENFSTHPDVIALYENPTIDNQEIVGLLKYLLGSNVTDEQKNFIKLLIYNKRLKSLKTISKVYTELLNEHMSIDDVDVISSMELSDDMKKNLQDKLKKKLNLNQVKLNCIIDEDIIGGLVVRVGDHVVDGSIKNNLRQLTTYVLN